MSDIPTHELKRGANLNFEVQVDDENGDKIEMSTGAGWGVAANMSKEQGGDEDIDLLPVFTGGLAVVSYDTSALDVGVPYYFDMRITTPEGEEIYSETEILKLKEPQKKPA